MLHRKLLKYNLAESHGLAIPSSTPQREHGQNVEVVGRVEKVFHIQAKKKK